MFRRIGGGVNKGIESIAGALLLVAVLSSLIDVGNRIFIGYSLPWSHTISLWACISLAFLLTGVVGWKHTYIGVDIVIKRLKGLTWKIFNSINNIATLAFCILAVYAGIYYILALIRREFTVILGVWSVPFWPVILFTVTIGMALGVIYSIVTLIYELRTPHGTSEGAEPSEKALKEDQ